MIIAGIMTLTITTTVRMDLKKKKKKEKKHQPSFLTVLFFNIEIYLSRYHMISKPW